MIKITKVHLKLLIIALVASLSCTVLAFRVSDIEDSDWSVEKPVTDLVRYIVEHSRESIEMRAGESYCEIEALTYKARTKFPHIYYMVKLRAYKLIKTEQKCRMKKEYLHMLHTNYKCADPFHTCWFGLIKKESESDPLDGIGFTWPLHTRV